ncbi:MarR family winged helix-turn-helix transcriptional regulator [Compostimonas suwonensis]|uniref:DNA-binding MarR family transcriptional regulator n=1 Tax=Compostimonas suwonensis TaxID=1048394 RepID=A0A2M9BB35_9MICO|nr:MarR family transcriptional regulator [Compostimonas suwonensis]PJJ55160.1 DNA-binding MarR family transcriptional regulator [Compostimonas suwonensis]
MDTAPHASDDERAQLASRLAIAIGRINRRIRPHTGIMTYAQLSALSSIVRLGPLRPGDLARLEAIAAPSATRLIAGLESEGFVTRTADPADGRAFFIQSTDAGAEAVLRARAERAELLEQLLTDSTDEQIARLAASVDVLEAAAVAGAPVIPGIDSTDTASSNG